MHLLQKMSCSSGPRAVQRTLLPLSGTCLHYLHYHPHGAPLGVGPRQGLSAQGFSTRSHCCFCPGDLSGLKSGEAHHPVQPRLHMLYLSVIVLMNRVKGEQPASWGRERGKGRNTKPISNEVLKSKPIHLPQAHV